MNEDLNLNPQAMPFMPGGGSNDRRHWNPGYNYYEGLPSAPPSMPPFAPPSAPWNANHAPQQYFTGNQYDVRAAREQATPYQWQWSQMYGHPNYQTQPQPYGPPPVPQQHHYPYQPPPPYQNHPGYPHPAYHAAMQQTRLPRGATNEELQYAFNALIKALKSKKSTANSPDRAPTQPLKKSKKTKAKAKAAADSEVSQEYGSLHRVDPFVMCSSRINKLYSTPQPAKGPKKGRYGDEKIMLPAPRPTEPYLTQASEEPSVISLPTHKNVLVILDLNGTVLYRPNKNAKTMIARPYLKPFLRYLFQNFKVMVWSSAQPVNVKSLVDQALDKEFRSLLVATWARDTFGLSAKNYSQNVQVYKNLRLVWSRDQIQQHHPEYANGKRFGQHNTVLIDDSAIKASAQPYNLLEIPEFEATQEQMEGDVLREVAGYLESLRQQADISRFIRKEPFKSDGRWTYDWPAEAVGGGDMKTKISLKGKSPSAVSQMMNSLASVSLGAAEQKEA